MTITHKMTLDLQRKGEMPRIDVVQGDAFTRQVDLVLENGGKPWLFPICEPVARYCKPDGTMGVYDTLPTGAPAFSYAGNILTLVLAPQMLTCRGVVQVQVEMNAQDLKLATFTFLVVVEPGVALYGESEDYVNWTKAFLPQATGAKVGQYLQISKVDDAGRITEMAPAENPAGEATNKAYEALRIANDVAQEMQAYSPSGTRSIAEAAMRMASERLVAPKSASVGQYFRVKEVDANGMVTEVEAVDAPSGGNGSGSSQNVTLTTAQVNALDGMFRIAKYESDPTGAYAAFCSAFGITAKTLESITAVYSGGEVSVGTALSELYGITVTAAYSDSSTETVTGYTLSGEIIEGSNTITVSYGGQSTTITVVGVASGDGGEGEPTEPLYGVFWPPKGKVLDWNVPEWDDVENFAYTSNINGTPSEYENAGLPSGAFVRLDKLQGTVYIRTLTKNQYGIMEQGCYQVYANSNGEISTGGFEKVPATVYRQFGGKEKTMEIDGTTYYFMMFKFEIPVGQTGYFVGTANAMRDGYFVSSDLTGIDDAYKPYYTLFGSDPTDRITEPATEVA